MPTWTLRPYLQSGDWTAVSGGSVADESNSTYSYFTNVYQYADLRFSTSPIPWDSYGLVSRAMRIRILAKVSTGDPAHLAFSAYTADTTRPLIRAGDQLTVAAVTTSFTEYTSPYKVVLLTGADGDIALLLHPTIIQGGSNQLQISEVYLDIDTVYPPIVSLTRPTGTYTTTSAVPFAYTFFSQDGYQQVAYRYFIYNDDQYNAVGFVPGVSPAVYSSGIIYNRVRSGNLHPVPNDNYKVYFQGAQSVNGQLQWSLITNTGAVAAFVVNITPPAAPTLSATADSTNARILLEVTGAGASGSVQDVYEIQKSFDSGVTWEAVRADLGSYLGSSGGARSVYDYETGNGQAVVYRARTLTYDFIGQILVGPWSTTTGSTSWTSSSTWLKIPTRPDLNRVIQIRAYGDEDFPRDQGVFQGLGSQEAVVVSGLPRTQPSGSFIIASATQVELLALRAVLATGEPWLVHASSRSSDWYQRNRYLMVGGSRIRRLNRTAWEEARDIVLDYTEVDTPDVDVYPLQLGLTTFQDIDDQFSTFTAFTAAFTTYGQIRG